MKAGTAILQKGVAMITKARTVGVYVSDQDRALDFYVDKLGFEKRTDEPMGPEARWIEVAPAGAETVLVLFTPPGQEDRIGTFSNVVFECDDIEATYRELRGRGVEFTEEPSEQPWGMWAQFKDVDGNEFGLIQN
jgi:predicted enzyme related to lactoylglutathione lyase